MKVFVICLVASLVMVIWEDIVEILRERNKTLKDLEKENKELKEKIKDLS